MPLRAHSQLDATLPYYSRLAAEHDATMERAIQAADKWPAPCKTREMATAAIRVLKQQMLDERHLAKVVRG